MKFKIFKDKKGEFRFNGVANNGKIIFKSEGYKRKQSVIKTINLIKSDAKSAKLE